MSVISLQSVELGHKKVLERYFQFYLYDYAAFDGKVPIEGVFEYPWLDDYFTESGRYPFFILKGNSIAGISLVRELSDGHYQMSEFFIMNVFRKQGIGEKACALLFDKFPGRWDIGQEFSNAGAIAFWRKVISQYAEDYEEKEVLSDDGNKRVEQTFLTY